MQSKVIYLSAGLVPVCCKRTSIEPHVAGTEVKGLNLVGPVNSMQGKQNWTGM